METDLLLDEASRLPKSLEELNKLKSFSKRK